MAKPSTAARAILTVLVLGGFTVAYVLAGYWTPLQILTAYSLVFWIGVVVSVVLFIWKVLPQWLIALAWAILAVYLVFFGRPEQRPSAFAVYFVIALFALFLILLARWAYDVRRARRVARRLDERTLAELKRLEGSIAETRGEAQRPSSGEATTQALLRLHPATVQALGDVANLSRQIQAETQKGFPMDTDRILQSISELQTTMVVRGVTRSSRSTVLTAIEVLVGGPVSVAIAALLSGLLGLPPFT